MANRGIRGAVSVLHPRKNCGSVPDSLHHIAAAVRSVLDYEGSSNSMEPGAVGSV